MTKAKKVALRAVLTPTELLNSRLGKDSARARLGRAIMEYLVATSLPTNPLPTYRVLRGERLEVVIYWQPTE